MDDKDIVDLYFKRDETAIKITDGKYGKYCFSIAFNILNNKEDADEGVNDTYMSAWNSIPPNRPAVLQTYLGKLTRYICLKKWRYMHTQKRGGGEVSLIYDELSDCISTNDNIELAVEAKELALIIDEFLKSLPAVQRKVFVCRYWYFDSISSISRQFNFSESKVKSMLFRTRSKLLFKLKKEGVFVEK